MGITITSLILKEAPNLSPTVIRLDILVEVIRGSSVPCTLISVLTLFFQVSGNPQTFQQALLLIANLARLAPDSVLYNVMPVFTFMGSNVFHRDDSYSFKVVQQVRMRSAPSFNYLHTFIDHRWNCTCHGFIPERCPFSTP